ncbi:hypothetical protein EE612_031629, partial [Oryza sativa]
SSAGATAEADGAAADVVEHLVRLLLHVPDEPEREVSRRRHEREAPLHHDSHRVQPHHRAAVEHQRHRRHRHAREPDEVVAGVQPGPPSRHPRVRRHGAPERQPQRPVRRRRQLRDDHARVHHRAAGEHHRRHVQPPPADLDAPEANQVQRRDDARVAHQRRPREPPRAAAVGRAAEREEAGGARVRDAVGERVPERRRRLRQERLAAAAERHGAGGGGAEVAAHGVAAAEAEVHDDGARVEREGVHHVRPRGGPAVAVVDEVLALVVGATSAVAAELAAGGGAARHGGGGPRPPRVKQGVLLRVALRHGARRALDPWQVDAGVDGHRLRQDGVVDRRRAADS